MVILVVLICLCCVLVWLVLLDGWFAGLSLVWFIEVVYVHVGVLSIYAFECLYFLLNCCVWYWHFGDCFWVWFLICLGFLVGVVTVFGWLLLVGLTMLWEFGLLLIFVDFV